MATAIIPMASAGGCAGCCPKWVVGCCDYRNCGIPSRLLLTSSLGTQHLLFDGIGWTGALQFEPVDSICVAEIAFYLSCENNEWRLAFQPTIFEPGIPSNSSAALEVTCKPFNATFLIEGVGVVPDIVATVTEENDSKCHGCCGCFPNRSVYLAGPVAYGDGYCTGGDALYGETREVFQEVGDCVDMLIIPDKGLFSEFLPDYIPCLCVVVPGFEQPYTPFFTLTFEPDGDDCRVIVTHKIGHYCAEPFLCEQFARWSRIITEDECRNFYGGILTLTLEDGSGGEFADPPETIDLEIE